MAAAHGDLIIGADAAPDAAAAPDAPKTGKRPTVEPMAFGDLVGPAPTHATAVRAWVPGRGNTKTLKPTDQDRARLYVVAGKPSAEGAVDPKRAKNFSVLAGSVQPASIDDVCIFRTAPRMSDGAQGFHQLNRWAVVRVTPTFAHDVRALEAQVFQYCIENQMLFSGGKPVKVTEGMMRLSKQNFVEEGGDPDAFGLMEYLEAMNIAQSCVGPMMRNKEPVEGEFSLLTSFRLWSSEVQESGPNKGEKRTPQARTKMLPVDRALVPASVPLDGKATQPGPDDGTVWVHGVVKGDAAQVVDVEAAMPLESLVLPAEDQELDFDDAVRMCHFPPGTAACIQFHVEQVKFVKGKYKLGLRPEVVRVLHPEHPVSVGAADAFGSDDATVGGTGEIAQATQGVDIEALLAQAGAVAAVGGVKRGREEEEEGAAAAPPSPKRTRDDDSSMSEDEAQADVDALVAE
jgi:hypothetical protein